MPDRMPESVSEYMPERMTSRWYVRNYVRIVGPGGDHSKKVVLVFKMLRPMTHEPFFVFSVFFFAISKAKRF